MKINYLLLSIFFVLLWCVPAWAELLEKPVWRNPVMDGEDLKWVVYGNGVFVAAGTETVYYSADDGVTWNKTQLDVPIKDIAFGNGRFIIASGPRLLVSTDGASWAVGMQASQSERVSSVGYGDGRFIAAGYYWNGRSSVVTVWSSTDGNNWARNILNVPSHITDESLITARAAVKVVYGKGRWIVVNVCGYSDLLVSDDGAKWTVRTFTGIVQILNSVVYANDVFVATGNGFIFWSMDGKMWHQNDFPPHQTFTSVSFTNGNFMVFDYYDGTFYTSFDGRNWVARDTGRNIHPLVSAAYGNGVYVGVGDNGYMTTSTDLLTWTPRVAGFTLNDFSQVVFGNGVFAAYDSESKIYVSRTGSEWTKVFDSSAVVLYGLSFANGRFFGCTAKGFLVSGDGRSWSEIETGSSGHCSNVTYGGGLYVAPGQGGVIATSQDGVSWSSGQTPATEEFTSVAYGNGLFLAVAGTNMGTLFKSVDGLNWTAQPADVPSGWRMKVRFLGGRFYLASGSSTLYTSANGTDWVTLKNNFGSYGCVTDVAYGDGVYAAAGCGVLYSAADPLSWWNQVDVPFRPNIAYGNGTFVLVGEYGSVMTASSRCTTVLHEDLGFHVPFLTIGYLAYWADFTYTGKPYQFAPARYGFICDLFMDVCDNHMDSMGPSPCTSAALDEQLDLHIPSIKYLGAGADYWLDFSVNGGVIFGVTDGGLN